MLLYGLVTRSPEAVQYELSMLTNKKPSKGPVVWDLWDLVVEAKKCLGQGETKINTFF